MDLKAASVGGAPTDLTLPEYLLDRFVEYRGGCWEWTGMIDRNGYGIAWDQRTKKRALAHRLMYDLLVGPPPDTLHHECENRACVNVGEHVFASTRGQNAAMAYKNRSQLCQRGHNRWYVRKNGTRVCRECQRIWRKERYDG